MFIINVYSEQLFQNTYFVYRYVGGDTNTSGGLWQMLDKVFTDKNPGDRPNVPNIGIVITGKSVHFYNTWKEDHVTMVILIVKTYFKNIIFEVSFYFILICAELPIISLL